ncbi:transposase [Variovorax boronicumulans]
MHTLDKELSKHVEVARTRPVLVDRYGVPWVWIVSHSFRVEDDCLKSYAEPDHGLVALREAIDSVLAHEGLIMSELTARCVSGVDARMITRAWLLQIVYSLADPKRVRKGLVYNMLWRWFVGYSLRSEPLPEPQAFIQDIKMVSAHPRVIDIVFRCLSDGSFLHADPAEFRINYGWLHSLRADHLEVMDLSRGVPAGRNQNDRRDKSAVE